MATARPLLGFHESATLDPGTASDHCQGTLDRLAPTWSGTNLGQALVDTVAAIEDVADTSEKTARMPRRVVLISDLAQGSRLDALGDFEWPSDVELDLKTVADTGSNAGLERLADQIEAEPGESDTSRRVRVVNNPGSGREKFELIWSDEKGVAAGKPIDVYVPPGESRVVRVPSPPASLPRQALRLRGDTQGFDNTLYFADERRGSGDRRVHRHGSWRRSRKVFFITFSESLLTVPSERCAFSPTSLRKRWIGIRKIRPQLVVVAAETPKNVSGLGQYINQGGTVLYVVTAPGRAETLAGLAGVTPWNIEEAAVGR